MKRILLLFTILFIQITYSQIKEESIKLYQTTADFVNDSIWEVSALAQIKKEHNSYIQIKK